MSREKKENTQSQGTQTNADHQNSAVDISQLVQLCFVGLIGANNEMEKVLRDFHEKYDKPSHGFLFYDYLLHQPLHR